MDRQQVRDTRTIALAATFTTDPIRQPLRRWMHTVQIAADVVVAPYAQVLQELLRPSSLLGRNVTGFNVLLIRLEDWIRDRSERNTADNLLHIGRVAEELADAIGSFRERVGAPLLVFFCPVSSALGAECRIGISRIQQQLTSRLHGLAHIHCLTHDDLVRRYPVTDYEDPRSDRIGHIPYTEEYFAALATLLARRITVSLKPPYKVIAVDCDNTLWKGICGEDDAAGVVLTDGHLRFQQLLVDQHDAGMLICLCSKNNEQDVEKVFASRPEMPLRMEHIVAVPSHRIGVRLASKIPANRGQIEDRNPS